MNPDDPNLTAYALDELPESERRAIENEIARSPEAQAFVRQTQETAQLLRDEFQTELQEAARKPSNIMPLPMPRSFWSDARWLSIGLAALLAVAAIIAAIALSPSLKKASQTAGEVQMEFETQAEAPFDLVADSSGENSFLSTATNPVSALSFNLGRESYENVRRQVANGKKPPATAVRIEELINHFAYEYPDPKPGETFAINLAATGCPWQSPHRLVRVAVKARQAARRVRLVVNFNPANVESYRLLGYEDRRSATAEDANESRVDAGQTLTALYEIVPVGNDSLGAAPPASVTLTYGLVNDDRKRIIQHATLEDYGNDFESAPNDFKFAAAVAEFGMILRDSPHKGNATLASVLAWSNESKGADENGQRAEFIELVRKAQTL